METNELDKFISQLKTGDLEKSSEITDFLFDGLGLDIEFGCKALRHISPYSDVESTKNAILGQVVSFEEAA